MKAKIVPQSAVGSNANPIITRKAKNPVRTYIWKLTTTPDQRLAGELTLDDPDYLYMIGRENSLEPTTVLRSFNNFNSVRSTVKVLGQHEKDGKIFHHHLFIDGVKILEWPE
jgi:hypothetical protein